MIFVEILGAAMMVCSILLKPCRALTIPMAQTTFDTKPSWGVLYDDLGLGGLLFAPLSPMGGFGRFLLVILALSIVANKCGHPSSLLYRY